MVTVMLGAGTKARVMDRGLHSGNGLVPSNVPTDIEGQAKGLREDRARSWKEAG